MASTTPIPAAKSASRRLDPLDLYDIRSELDDDARMVQDTVRRFVVDEFMPQIRDAFEKHYFPTDLVPQIAELGLLGSSIEGYDCAGMNSIAYGVICQELERGDSGLRSFVSVQSSLVMYPIYAYGSEEQRQRWLPPLARGEAIGCFGLTEPHGGSDPSNMKTRAKKDGDDWVLSGSKMWITNGSIADVAVVWAMTEDGIRGFIVEKDMPGFTAQEIENKFSLRASVTGALFLDNVRVPADNVLPNVKGLKGPLGCLTQARYGITWGVIGAAQACLEEALDYCSERVLFNRPLTHTQSVQMRLADMARRITGAQLLSLRLGRLKDAGEMTPTQVSVAKWNNCRAALDIARDARDLLGGSGISAEYAAIRHMLNLESVITYEGTEAVHKLVVGKELTGVNAFEGGAAARIWPADSLNQPEAIRDPDSRDVWRIALPMILSNVSVPLLGMVDTGVTGHLDDAAYLGAVAVGSALFGFLFIGFNFLRMGTTGITAQKFGRRDYGGLRSALGQAVIAALVIAAALLLLQRPIGTLGLRLLGPEAPVMAFAQDYFFIRIWSAPATLVNYALIGWFIGLQNARVPLLIVIATNAVNIVLDLVFVLVFDMKVIGVAAASVIAETSGSVIGILFAARELAKREGSWAIDDLTSPAAYTVFFSINANLFLRTIALVSTLTFVTAQSARLGGLVLAANAVLMNLQNLIAFVLDSIAHAAEALVGKAIGQESLTAVERAVAVTLRWSLGMALAFCGLFALGGPSLIRLLTDLPGVREVALDYLPWIVLSPIVSVWSFLYDGVFVGATRAREMRNIMLLSALGVFLPAWYLLQPLGNHGLWLAFTLFMGARGLGMHWAYRQRVLPAFAL